MFNSTEQPRPSPLQARSRPRWRRLATPLLLVLLAGHLALIQLATGVQYGDATRNLHWGLLTWENPGFLAGAPDTYERIKGFTPVPTELAPAGRTGSPYGGLHRWWGPVTPLLFAYLGGRTLDGGADSFARCYDSSPLPAAGARGPQAPARVEVEGEAPHTSHQTVKQMLAQRNRV